MIILIVAAIGFACAMVVVHLKSKSNLRKINQKRKELEDETKR